MAGENATSITILKTSSGIIKEGMTLEQAYQNKKQLEVFTKIDTNRDKKISAEEIYTYKGINLSDNGQNFYPGLTLGECKSNGAKKFKELDTNGDKKLSEKEVKIGILKERIKELNAIKNYDLSELNKLDYYQDLADKRGSEGPLMGGIAGTAVGFGVGVKGGLAAGSLAAGLLGGPIGVAVALGVWGASTIGGAYLGSYVGGKIQGVDDTSIDKMIQTLEKEIHRLEKQG